MVSRFDHALLHLLYQIRVGWLDAEVAGIVSNHEDARSIAEAAGVPFHLWPVSQENRAEQEERLENFLRADWDRGFEFSRAPLMRLGLIRRREDSYYFVWSNHHILLDGWCRQLILQEVFAFYEAGSEGRELQLKQARPYRDYIAWLTWPACKARCGERHYQSWRCLLSD